MKTWLLSKTSPNFCSIGTISTTRLKIWRQMIEVSNLQLVPVQAQNGLVFFASFTLDNAFQLANIAVYSRKDGSGFRCVYPVKELANGTRLALFHPLSKEVGDYIESLITSEANQLLM